MSEENKVIDEKEIPITINKIVEEEMLEAIGLNSNVMQMSKDPEALAKLWEAFSKFLGEVQHPKQTKQNPFLKNMYAPLDSVLNEINPILSKNGLSILQIPYVSQGNVSINSILTHKSGAFIVFPPLVMKPDNNKPQAIGGAISYGRRYAISTICGVASEADDDGNGASGVTQPKPKTTPKQNHNQPAKPPAKEKVDPELKKIIDEIGKIAGEKAKIDKKAVGECVKKYGKVAKHTTIKDLKTANTLLTAMKQLEVKAETTEENK